MALKIKVIAFDDPTETHDLICGDYKLLTDTLKFEDKTNYYEVALQNASNLTEDDTFTPKILNFESVVHKGEDVLEFKKFFRWENRKFILEITKNGQKRFVIAKRNQESVEMLGWTGDMETEKFSLSFITMCNFIKLKIFTKTIEYPEVEEDAKGYYDNELNEDPNGYIYNKNEDGDNGGFVYPVTGASQSFFPVDLPENEGDKKAYLKVEALEWQSNPSWGLDTKASDTFNSYIAQNLLRTEEEILVNDSFPLLCKLETRFPGTIKTRRTARPLRDITKETFLTIPKDKKNHTLVFSDATKVRITVYEQYRSL